MAATTTQTIHLLDCPACRGPVIANLTYSVKLNPAVYAEGAPIGLIDKTATATLTLTGVRVQHECPPPKLLRDKGIASPALPNPLTRED